MYCIFLSHDPKTPPPKKRLTCASVKTLAPAQHHIIVRAKFGKLEPLTSVATGAATALNSPVVNRCSLQFLSTMMFFPRQLSRHLLCM